MQYLLNTPAFSFFSFFEIDLKIQKIKKKLEDKHLLPNFSTLSKKRNLSSLSMGWMDDGLLLQFSIAYFENFLNKTANEFTIELFFDTRNMKNKPRISEFCHHFLILPSIEKSQIIEITRFFSDDSHILADPEEMSSKMIQKKSFFLVDIHLPAKVLHGFDPKKFSKIGFGYKISLPDGQKEVFPIIEEVNLEKNPSWWASGELVDE